MAERHPIPSDPRFQDLTGFVYGKLTVLFYAGKKSGKYSLWHCRCECGQGRTVVSSQLTLGQTTSCVPCFRHRPKVKRRSDFEDLTGKVFGRLTVVGVDRHVKTPRGTRTYWRCQCSCGETAVVRGDILKDGRTASCGCLNISKRWVDQPMPETAICRICKNPLPLTTENFYRHPRSKYGFNRKCIPCCKEASKASHTRHVRKLHMDALIAYSGNPPRCQCPGGCSETYEEFLTIDHIEGGGNKHRHDIGGNFYRWLRQNKYPPGFRVLCMNCNFAIGKRGYCPHCRDSNSTKR